MDDKDKAPIRTPFTPEQAAAFDATLERRGQHAIAREGATNDWTRRTSGRNNGTDQQER